MADGFDQLLTLRAMNLKLEIEAEPQALHFGERVVEAWDAFAGEFRIEPRTGVEVGDLPPVEIGEQPGAVRRAIHAVVMDDDWGVVT